jgi:Obg family GTPase CgtA
MHMQPPSLRIPVPPGTVVRRRRGRILLGDLVRPGQTLRVASGGRGGLGARASGEGPRTPRLRAAAGIETSVLEADDATDATEGEPGEEIALELLLRVVADVGIVGLPNAGKSSLLAALTRASPEVAPYPFTTLMPNLGVLSTGSDPSLPTAVLADLPGLIAGAHKGVGLGRAFLRHLRRTRCTLHVVDASTEDPYTDYLVVREELRLYNPEYCARPFLVALNKTDAHGVAERLPALRTQLEQAAEGEGGAALGRPSAVCPVSALTGDGLAAMLISVEALIREANAVEGLDDDPELRLTEEEEKMIAAASR